MYKIYDGLEKLIIIVFVIIFLIGLFIGLII